MADIFLSASVTVLFDRLASVELLQLARQVGIDAQLKKWRSILSKVQAVLADAEEKQLKNRAVKLWLSDLQHLGYDLDDILDNLETEILRRQVIAQSQATTSKVSSLVSSYTNNFSPMNFFFNYDIGSKINDISGRLEEIFKEKNDLDLKENVRGMQHSTRRKWPSTSLVEPRVCGREEDKELIIEMLLNDEGSDDEKIVIPIFGIGGVGKTTLAQLVYNDERVDKNYELKAWAWVSDSFDIHGVTKTILESLSSQACNIDALNTLQVTLKGKLLGKKFLLVLDDIWNEDYEEWDLLRRPLLFGAPGSKIIVTTRIFNAAKMMSRGQVHHLKQLEDSHCSSLLAQHALGRYNFEKDPELKEVGEKILKKCQGLPLAVKSLGSLLRTKRYLNQWEEILNSKIWELPEQPGGILPALHLSYHHLLSHLKHCFAFCAVYPKGFELDKFKLIKLWMAVGLLPRSTVTKQSEDFGSEYFDDLLSRSFFQQSATSESKFVMHDLINDLAVYVAGERCFRLEDKLKSRDVSERVRYSSYVTQRFNVFEKFKIYYKFKRLRTFLRLDLHYGYTTHLSNKVLHDIVPQLRCLRLLSLSGNNILELPASIGDLKQLRYLDLSHTPVKKLPESVGALYNLQTLLLCGCKNLQNLPLSVVNLVNLRHLDNADTRELQEMPHGIGKLTNLQTLSKIVVGDGSGFPLSELRNMMHLRGKMIITELQNVTDIQDAHSLRSKQDLHELVLEWSTKLDESRDTEHESDVLGDLQPHRNLEKLEIRYYRGTKLPGWVGDRSYTKMLEINLIGCERCISLPPLGQLHLLKVLCIQGMLKLTSLGDEFYKDECSSDFPFLSLESLTFDDMPEWEEWHCLGSWQFPVLQKLIFRKCPQLVRIPQLKLPSLCTLLLEDCHGVVPLGFSNLTSLTTLTIDSVKELTCLPKEFINSCTALEFLEMKNCEELVSLWGVDVTINDLICLKEMKVESCPRLVSLCAAKQALPSNLEVLSIFKCDNLVKTPNGPSLMKLSIGKCPKLLSIAEGTSLPSMLHHLEIKDCWAVESLPDYVAGISSLQVMKVSNCSSLRWWPIDKSPTTLKKLSISKDCRNLEIGIELQGLNGKMQTLSDLNIRDSRGVMGRIVKCQHLASLVNLVISNCENIDSFRRKGWPPIPNLKVLRIGSCKNLISIPLDQIQNLESLEISYCKKLVSFPDGFLPSKLTILSIRGCGEFLNPLSIWGLHRLTSLLSFSICGGFSEMVSISDNDEQPLLPSTLKELSIEEFPNLESWSKGLKNNTSLEHLILRGCPKLRSLPEENLVRGLSSLEVKGCPILEQQCLPKGYYRPIIADIPRVKIANCYIHNEGSSAS